MACKEGLRFGAAGPTSARPPLGRRLLAPAASEQCFLKSTPRVNCPSPRYFSSPGAFDLCAKGGSSCCKLHVCDGSHSLDADTPVLGRTQLAGARPPLSSLPEFNWLRGCSSVSSHPLRHPPCARRWADAGVGETGEAWSWPSPEARPQWQETDREGRAAPGSPERGAGWG